jgi:hypothetical protein
MTKPRKTKKVVVSLEAKPRKKTVPKTAYTKDNPSPFAFKPGESGNSAGKKRNETRLLSKALNVFLSDHAPDDLAKAMGLPPNTADGAHYRYSHAQCLAKRILNLALRGESWAVSEISRLTEPVNARLGVFGFDGEGEEARSPIFELVMVSADGDGRISKESLAAFPELAAKTIEGQSMPALAAPAPED